MQPLTCSSPRFSQTTSPAALIVAPWGEPLQRHWRTGVEHAMRRSARWCVLFNGSALRIIDAARPHSSRFMEFDLDAAGAGDILHLVVGQLRSLDTLIHESDQHGVAVCRSLRDGV